jgi:hypothetical protein
VRQSHLQQKKKKSSTHPAMPSLFPSSSALSAVFGKESTPVESSEKKKLPSGSQFQTWSVTEDAERKASELSSAAAKEYQKASSIAQAKAGDIELYSAKYCEFLVLADSWCFPCLVDDGGFFFLGAC